MAIEHITKDNYDELVKNSGKKVLLDFWATWCGPCRMVAPIVEEIAAERSDLLVGKVDVDEQMELAMQFRVVSIPTLVVLEAGQEINRLVGYRPKEDILEIIGD